MYQGASGVDVFFNEILIGRLEFVPAVPVIQVVHAELPKFVRILEPGFQPSFLFRLGNIQEQLDDDGAFFRKHGFKIQNVLVTSLPDGVREDFFHADGDDVLVMGTVEDGDLPLGGHFLVHAPQEVVVQFFNSWVF